MSPLSGFNIWSKCVDRTIWGQFFIVDKPYKNMLKP